MSTFKQPLTHEEAKEHLTTVFERMQRRHPDFLRPPPPPIPLPSETPQIQAWTDFCFYRESLSPPYDDPERVYTVFAASTEDDRIFFGSVPFSVSDANITWEQITASLKSVNDEQLYPVIGSLESYAFTMTPGPDILHPAEAYVKRNLGMYGDYVLYNRTRGEAVLEEVAGQAELATNFLEEAKIHELIHSNPTKTRPGGIWGHPNIAEYFGVKINGSRITGLVFARYRQNLWQYALQFQPSFVPLEQAVHPQAMNPDHINQLLTDLEDAVLNYLHKQLNVAHNDIHPGTIMVEIRGGRPMPFLTGFGMARKVGERIWPRKGGMEETFLRDWGWRCEGSGYERSEKRHDVWALGRLRGLLEGSVVWGVEREGEGARGWR